MPLVTDEELMTAFTGAQSFAQFKTTDLPVSQSRGYYYTFNYKPFLLGQMGGNFAPKVDQETCYSPKKQWRRIQELIRHFWHRWIDG